MGEGREMNIPAKNDKVEIEYKGETLTGIVDDVGENGMIWVQVRGDLQLDENDGQFYWKTPSGKTPAALHGAAKGDGVMKIRLRWND
jgi:hypothetical protein